MKKIIALIVAGAAFCGNISAVIADDRIELGNTGYYALNSDNDIFYNIYNSDGSVLKENLYREVEYKGGGIIVRLDSNNLCGVLDNSLNQAINVEYDYIDFNENTNCYECFYYDKDNVYRVDFYNDSFERVLQPKDIRSLEGTDCYYERVIGENNAHREYVFICDSEGNRIIDEGFSTVRAENGNAVVKRGTDSKEGLIDKEFNIVNNSFYDVIYFNEDTNCFELINFVNDDNGNTVETREYVNADLVKVNPVRNFEDSMYCTVEENGVFYICDETGKHLSEKPYYEIESIGSGYLKVRSSNKYPYKYGLLDVDLNNVIDEKYFNIENKNTIYCYDNGKTIVYNSKADEITKEYDNNIIYVTPIKDMEGKYVYDMYPLADIPNDSKMVIDDNGSCLSKKYLSISTEAGLGGTLAVQKRVGMGDSRCGILNSEFKEIVPTDWYSIDVKEEKGVVYIVANSGSDHYFDLSGNEYGGLTELTDKNGNANIMSNWARESIERAIENNIVPESLQGFYTSKITRKEFCQLAMQTYISKTGYNMDYAESPFTDVNNEYVTHAERLKIVSGVGNNKFAPDNNITRQEAAVMLNNLAKLLGVESRENVGSFVDESYFADWAKSAIYSVAGMKSGDTYVMAGTGNGKFSPWMSYTREQAVATMLRLYEWEKESE